jgi:hypothetical protein
MTLIKLEELQEYCKYKSIALVGNSSNILRKNKGKEIDAHDIIIRMNHSVNVIDKHYKDIGKRTDIYDCEVSPLHLILKLTGMSNAKYITRLIRWGDTSTKANETIVINSVNKIYLGNPKVHQRLRKSHFNNKVKPSTGAALFNFLIEFTDFKSINLYGFDFFTSSLRNRNNMNEFNSYCYKDHSSQYEQAYFKNS